MVVDESSVSVTKARLPRSLTTATITDIRIQFLKLALRVVITPPNETAFEKFQVLPHPVKQVILRLWKEMTNDPEDDEVDRNSDKDSGGRSSNSVSPARIVDRELLLEHHLAQLKSQLDRCAAEVKDMREAKEEIEDAYNRLQESHDAVRKENIETGAQLKKIMAVHSEGEQRSVKELEAKISQQEEVLGRQESQINEHRSKEAEMQRKLMKLDAADDRLQNLQDDFDVQKVELEHQTRKANAGEKYKQKVQASQNMEKERDSLRKELNETRARLEDAEGLRRDNLTLQQENREISQTLSRSERDNTELRETKQAYHGEINRLQRDSKSLRDALAQSQDRVADLDERFGGRERHQSLDDGLDSELAEALNHEQQMQVASTVLLWTRVLMSSRKIRITELEKQVRQLTTDARDKDTKFAMLQGQLGGAEEESANHCQQAFDIRQEMSILQSSLTEVSQGHPTEVSVPAVPLVNFEAYDGKSTEMFQRMRNQLEVQQKQCADLEDKLSAAEKALEVAESDRMSSFENHRMLTDLTIDLFEAVDNDEVRMQNSSALRQLQSEHDALRDRHIRLNEMFIDLTQERNDAWRESHETLIAKGEIQIEAEANSRTLQESTDLLRQATTPGLTGQSGDIETYASKIQEGRERLAKAQKVCKAVAPSDVAFSSPHSASSSSRLSSFTSCLSSASTSTSQLSWGLSKMKLRSG